MREVNQPTSVNKLLLSLCLFGLLASAYTSIGPAVEQPAATEAHTVHIPYVTKYDDQRSPPPYQAIRCAAIGDYGLKGKHAAAVAALIQGWSPDCIITLGDNNYDYGSARTIDNNVGQYYSTYIYPYTGSYTPGEPPNRFFPTLGNHDWESREAAAYFDYFPISTSSANTGSSGTELYYDFLQGPIHFFALNTGKDPNELNMDDQQAWLQAQLANSTAAWQIVYLHHAPYSSGARHGSHPSVQWPFETMGVDAVLAAHDHIYERLQIGNIPYFVNGLGGKSIRTFASPLPESRARYNDDYGAMLITATTKTLIFEFYSVADSSFPRDAYTLTAKSP